MTFTDIIKEVQRNTGRNDAKFLDRIKAAINRAVRQWARAIPWPALKVTGDITHQGGRELILPSEIDRLIWIMDKTNSRAVEAGSQWDRMDTYEYANDLAGFAMEWIDAGYTPLFTAVSGPLVVYSSGASDILTLHVYGQAQSASLAGNLGMYQASDQLNMVGASPYTTTNSYIRVDAIGKSADIDGVLTIECLGGIVGFIGPYEDEGQYRKIQFMDIPAANTVFKYGGYTRPPKLVDGNQHLPPSVDEDFVMWAASSDIFWQMREGSKAQSAWARAEEIGGHDISKEKQFGDTSSRIIPEDLT